MLAKTQDKGRTVMAYSMGWEMILIACFAGIGSTIVTLVIWDAMSELIKWLKERAT